MANQKEVSLLIEGQVFKVNKDLLIQYSDYFRAMFSGSYVENKKQEICIDVVDANSMKIILNYMALGLIDLSEHSLSTIGDLAFAANFLQITELTKQIDYCLEQQLSLTNWMEIKDIAQNAPSVKLEQAAVTYGLFSFKYMKPQYIPTLEQLYWYLSHPYLDTESELQVLKFGVEWVENKCMGAETFILLLCCLDMGRVTRADLREIKDLNVIMLKDPMEDYSASYTEEVVCCLCRLSTDYEFSLAGLKDNKEALCEMYNEKVYTEVLHLMTDSKRRKLRFMPAVPMWADKNKKPEQFENHMFTFKEESGFQQSIEVSEKNLWGWNITNWTPSKIVMVCGEYGRGTGSFMRDVKVYDCHSNEWIHHGVQLPVRRHAGVVVVHDSLYILGGVGGFRVVLDSAIIYDLKQRTYRKITDLPDPIQSPAVCAHKNDVYVVGYKHIYKFEDNGQLQWWAKVVNTEITPNFLVSFKGYIYVAQSYFSNLYRFRPGKDTALQEIACFNQPPLAICNLGTRVVAITCSFGEEEDVTNVEEFPDTNADDQTMKLLWSQKAWPNGISSAGSCSVVMTKPQTNHEVSAYHRQYIENYLPI